jgi:hypothetical protein
MSKTDTLLKEYRKLAGSMSYYNASEGSWMREAEARGKCSRELKAKALEMLENGFTLNDLDDLKGDFLLTQTDYITNDNRSKYAN